MTLALHHDGAAEGAFPLPPADMLLNADNAGGEPPEAPGDRMARAARILAWATWGCLAVGSALYFSLLYTVATGPTDLNLLGGGATSFPAWADALWCIVLLDAPAVLTVCALLAAAAAGALGTTSRAEAKRSPSLAMIVTTALTGGFLMTVLAFGFTGWSGDQLWGWPWA